MQNASQLDRGVGKSALWSDRCYDQSMNGESNAQRRFSLRRAVCSSLTLTLAACASEPKHAPTRVLSVPEEVWPDENGILAAQVHAWVVISTERGVLGLLETPRYKSGLRRHPSTVEPWTDPQGRARAIWGVSNPSRNGGLAVLTAAQGDRRHAIWLLQPNADSRQILEGVGDPLWDHPMSAMALSPNGRRLAFIAKSDPSIRYRPLIIGNLSIYDVAKTDVVAYRSHLPTFIDDFAVNTRPAWLDDGRRLLVAVAGPNGRASSSARNPSAITHNDAEIRLIDLESHTEETICSGHSPIASSDSKSMLFMRSDQNALYHFDLRSGQHRVIRRHHGLGTVLAFLDGRYVIYTGSPNPSAPVEQTTNNSPLVGPKKMRALKIQDIWTSEVLTLLEGIDPRRSISAASMI